jgi:hypothetical protein
MFENRMLRKMFGSQEKVLMAESRKPSATYQASAAASALAMDMTLMLLVTLK